MLICEDTIFYEPMRFQGHDFDTMTNRYGPVWTNLRPTLGLCVQAHDKRDLSTTQIDEISSQNHKAVG